ncbi:MAG: hypothetical protein QOE76_2259 [Frankiales bacterium]|nr:hypothetical protein [Frankiales bacterium]
MPATGTAAQRRHGAGPQLVRLLRVRQGVASAVAPVLAVVAHHHANAAACSPKASPRPALHTAGAAPRTVDKHGELIYRTAGVHDRVTAVLDAKRLGLQRP